MFEIFSQGFDADMRHSKKQWPNVCSLPWLAGLSAVIRLVGALEPVEPQSKSLHKKGRPPSVQEQLELELPLRLCPSQCTCGPFQGVRTVRTCADQSLGGYLSRLIQPWLRSLARSRILKTAINFADLGSSSAALAGFSLDIVHIDRCGCNFLHHAQT